MKDSISDIKVDQREVRSATVGMADKSTVTEFDLRKSIASIEQTVAITARYVADIKVSIPKQLGGVEQVALSLRDHFDKLQLQFNDMEVRLARIEERLPSPSPNPQ